MASFLESAYSLVHQDNAADVPTTEALRMQLEKGTDESKVETLKRILTIMLNGNPMPTLLMHIIRFVMPSKHKPLKKLLYFYYEVCPKLDDKGKLKQEMILVCNGIRNDLQHPNEYIRGNTLRFLCKLREPELIEPLLSSARSCLEHRHAYVRKNAVFAVASIYQHSPTLIPDAADLIATFLETESDATCKRNAFAALASISHDRALVYLSTVFDGIPNAEELLQLAEIEFIRKDAVQNSQNKARYLRLIFDLLEANDSTVVYEAASSLTALTSNPVAVKAAAAKFIELSIKEADNNVKLIVLGRVDQLRRKNDGVLDDLIMEILRVLSSTDIDVRRKALDLAMAMITSKNVEEVVLLLKKELGKTVDQEYEKNTEYRQLLTHSMHQCAIKFSEVAANVVELLMDLIGDFNNASAVDVINCVKEVVEKFPKLRPAVVERLVATLSEVRAGKVYRGILWVIGEYCLEEKDIRDAWKRIRASLGEIPILASEQRLLDAQDDDKKEKEEVNGHKPAAAPSGSRRVLADGTYATETALTSQSSAAAKLEAVKAAQKPPLRQLILDGDYYLATVLSTTLVKLVMRHSDISSDAARTNALRAEAMLILISIIRVGQSHFAKAPIDEDSVDRIMACVRSLAEFSQKKQLETVFLDDTRKAFRAMVQVEEKKRADQEAVERAKRAVQVDDVVQIRQLSKKNAGDAVDLVEADLERATGGEATSEDLSSKLSRVVQLTGFSDPVYAEAYVKVHQFDIVLDVLLVNQTTDTLQNLSVEFATLGDLKVVERPTTQNLGPHFFHNVQCTIKVSSTDTGVIFGNVVYDGPHSTDTNVVILNDLHVDIMDYIQPATCTETQFRTMWTEFEWENKVNINSKAKSLRDFLEQLMACTNMSCLTPEASMKGDCQFLSANLYARSVFGEFLSVLALQASSNNHRRGCAGKSQHRTGRRGRPHYGLRQDTEQVTGVGVEPGVAKGIEQDWVTVDFLFVCGVAQWYEWKRGQGRFSRCLGGTDEVKNCRCCICELRRPVTWSQLSRPTGFSCSGGSPRLPRITRPARAFQRLVVPGSVCRCSSNSPKFCIHLWSSSTPPPVLPESIRPFRIHQHPTSQQLSYNGHARSSRRPRAPGA
jgi:coatomer subunit beta